MKYQQKSAVVKSFSWAIILLYFIVLLFLLWSFFRGFDWTDESYYLLSYRYPEDVTKGVTFFHIYLGYIFKLLNYNIILLRIAGILFLQFSSLVLYMGFFKLALPEFGAKSGNGRFSMFSDYAFVGLGTLLAYSWYLPTPSYNLLNAIFMNVSTGLYFIGIRCLQNSSNSWRNAGICFFFSGVFLGGCFLTKFTTGIALLGLFLFASMVWSGISAVQKWRVSFFTLNGMFLWMMIHHFFIDNFNESVDFVTKGIDLISTMESNHGINSVLRHLLELKMLLITSLSSFWVLYICMLILGGLFVVLKRVNAKTAKTYYVTFLIFPVLSIAMSIYRGQYMGGIARYNQLAEFYLSVMLLLSAVVVMIHALERETNASGQKKINLIILLIMSFGLPLVGALGTGNLIYGIVPYYIAPWFAVFLLLSIKCELLFNSKVVKLFFILCISCFATAQILTGCLLYPYRLNSGVFDQVMKTSIGNPTSVLKLDEQSNHFVKELRKISENSGFKAGDDMLVFYDLPGVVYCLGGRSPGVPWYFGSYLKGFRHFAEKALADVPIDRIRNAFLLQTSYDISQLPDLKFFGINFPEDYDLCGQLESPYKRSKEKYVLWKPKLKSAGGFYLPAN